MYDYTYPRFRDRAEAGRLLAARLVKYKHKEGVLLAVPRGGVPVAYEVARILGLPMDLVLTKKIGHPMNKDYAIGAASLSDYFIIPHENVTDSYVADEVEQVRKRLREMYKKFIGTRDPEKIEGRTVIVVDDGVATGNTLLGTLQLLRKGNPRRIVVAAPVIPPESLRKLSAVADEVVAVWTPEVFYGVGAFYEDFEQVTDEEVLEYLEKLRAACPEG